MGLTPKLSVGGVMKGVTSSEFLAVGASIVLAPTLTSYLLSFIKSVPVLSAYAGWVIIGISVLGLLVAVKMKSGALRAIVIGFAGANIIMAILDFDVVKRYLPFEVRS